MRARPISDYGVIGNLRSVALVSGDGSVDWCCLPHLAAPSVFAALLDPRIGGRYRVGLGSGAIASRRYVEDTNVLETRWHGATGVLVVTDFIAFDSDALDAASLLIPIQELLPFDDPRVQSTIDRTLDQLTHNGLVYRYVVDDGLPGKEGAFGLTTFWLVDALALSGRRDEAHALFEGMVRRASPLGLYSEQIDPASGAFLGNFPQAFTHLGLINSALYLAYCEGKPTPVTPLLGTPEHRASHCPASLP